MQVSMKKRTRPIIVRLLPENRALVRVLRFGTAESMDPKELRDPLEKPSEFKSRADNLSFIWKISHATGICGMRQHVE
jgi:hypothetical protein